MFVDSLELLWVSKVKPERKLNDTNVCQSLSDYCSYSVLRHSSSDFKKMGQRIFVFIIGGATRSEVREEAKERKAFTAVDIWMMTSSYCNCLCFQLKVCHKLTTKLKREVILGSTSLDDPPQFITVSKSHTYFDTTEFWQTINPPSQSISSCVPQKLKLLAANELSIDDLQIWESWSNL